MIAQGQARYLTTVETLLCGLEWPDSISAELSQHFQGRISRSRDNAPEPHTSVSTCFFFFFFFLSKSEY